MPKDELFARARERVADFDFGEDTARVFDDMLGRSVPFYAEIQRMVAELAADFASDGGAIYDLGCSTCATFLEIAKALPENRDVHFVGLDSSEQMLERARAKLSAAGFRRDVRLECADLEQGVRLENASVALLILTLQFLRPRRREPLLRAIHEGLRDDGCLMVVEKVLGETSTFNRLFIDHYYAFKRRNGYSELEIAQKREALENVLVPYRLEENVALLREAGFRHVDVFFKWYNFCGIVATK